MAKDRVVYDRIKIRVEEDDFGDISKVSIYNQPHRGSRIILTPNGMKQIFTQNSEVQDSIYVSREAIQVLMDHLWAQGVRPAKRDEEKNNDE